MIRRALMSCLVVVSATLSERLWSASIPEIGIPYVEKAIKIDGRFDERDWAKAATLTRLNELGDKKPATPATSFRLQYNESALYILVQIQETPDHVNRAKEHGPMVELSNEDAVQVVLGSADAFITKREVLNMGGYEGAMDSEVTAADNYYQFTVNAAGSKARTYNETPVDRPLFESAVRRVESGWEVEMAIPFASWGLNSPVGRTAFANFFRFRPPAMMAWSLPSFGGYSAMPMGRIKFLKKEDADQATRQVVEAPAEAADVSENLPKRLEGTLGYYPLSGEVVASLKVPKDIKDAECVIQSNGENLGSWPLTDAPDQIFRASIQKGTQPERKLSLRIVGHDGSVMLERKNKFAAVTAPEWFGSDAGSAYLDKRVPTPWLRPEVVNDTIKLAQAELKIGKFGLFSGIKDNLGEFLSDDTQVLLEQDGKPLKLGKETVQIGRDGNFATTDASVAAGSGHLEVRTRVDYDGFTEVKLRLRDIDPKTVSRLTVILSMPSSSAKFVHQLLVQQIKELTGTGYACAEGALWVGNQEKGINFSYDVSPFLSKDTVDRLRVVEEGAVTKFEINLVSKAGQITNPDHIFRFFLQPTPTRPRSLDQGFSKVRFTWEQWASKQGELQFDKIPEIRKWTDELAQKGLIGTIYTTQGLAADTNEFKDYRSDLEIQPSWMCYKRGYQPGLDVPVYAVCRRGPDGERMLAGLKRFVDEAHVSGICDDGMSIAWECDNPSHPPGCGEPSVIGWDEKSDSRVLRQRDFLKRLRGIFDESGRPYFLSAHAGGGLDISTLSFFDGYMEGEQLARFRPGYQIPIGLYSVGYSGEPWGFRTRFWDKTWRRERGYYWSYAYVLLHGGDYEDNLEHYEITADFRDEKETVFHPYWRPGRDVSLSSDHSIYSYYKKSDSALVTVGNMTFRDDEITVDFGKLFPGKTIQVENVLAGEAVIALDKDKKLTRKLDPWKAATYRVRIVSDETSERDSNFAQTEFKAELWPIVGSTNGVQSEILSDEGCKEVGVRVESTEWQDRAVVEWNAPNASSVLSGKIKIQHTGRLTLQFGDAEITYDSGWQQSGFTGGHLFQAPIEVDRPVEIDFEINHGKLDLSYNGSALAQGLRLQSMPSQIQVKTWAGDKFSLWPISLDTNPSPIYEVVEGRVLVSNAPATTPFTITSYQANQWRVSQPNPVESERDGDDIVLSSTKETPAIATLDAVTFGENATISLLVTPTGCLDVSVGGVGIAFDWRWIYNGQLAGWNKGRQYPIEPPSKKPELLTISIANGIWTVTYAGRVLLKDMEFATYQKGGNKLQIKTWAGDTLKVKVVDLRSEAMPLIEQEKPHPIL